MAWSLQFLGYLRTLSLKFQTTTTRKTPILVRTFWNFKLKVLNYSRNCSLHATLIPNLVKPLKYILKIFPFCWSIQYQALEGGFHEQKNKTKLEFLSTLINIKVRKLSTLAVKFSFFGSNEAKAHRTHFVYQTIFYILLDR